MIVLRTIFVVSFLALSLIAFSQQFYATPTGTKYHLSTCRMVKNVSTKLSKDAVIKKGLQPCKICNPQNVYNISALPLKTAQGTAKKTVQCKAITKNGTRCKHMTSIANGYCFQHNRKN